MALVLSVNLILSALLGLAIFNLDKQSKELKGKKLAAGKADAAKTELGKDQAAQGPLVKDQPGQVRPEQSEIEKSAVALKPVLEKNEGRFQKIASVPAVAGQSSVFSSASSSARSITKPANPADLESVSSVNPRVQAARPRNSNLVSNDIEPDFNESTGFRSPKRGRIAGVRFSGVIGNKAILELRREGSKRWERPEVICLAAGEEVRSINNVPISVLDVKPEQVVFDVDGDRFVKALPQIH